MIHVLDSYYADTDKYNWILLERRTIDDEKSENYGKENDYPIGYFSSIEQLIRYIIRKKKRELGKKKVKELSEYADKIEQANDKLFKQIKKEFGDVKK